MGWFRSIGLLMLWQFKRLRTQLPIILTIQVVLATGIVYGMSFLIPNIDPRSALFLATGAPTIALLLLGLNVVPQTISYARLTGLSDYQSTLPVPRLALPAADVAFWILAQLPGTLLSVLVASIRFDFTIQPKLLLLPVILLVAFTGASVGYAMAMTLKPELANQLGSFIAIVILLFSPINFPAERLPGALQAIHSVLPIQYMADLMRWGFTGAYASEVGRSFVIVSGWCLLGLLTTWRVALRRK